MEKVYALSPLPYSADALAPVISKEQLTIHHDKHHKLYVDKANELLQKIAESRQEGDEIDVGVIAKKLSFNAGGDALHTLFWLNMLSTAEYKDPSPELKNRLETEFGDLERFKSEFTECATTIEGSGWVALSYSKTTGRLIINQIQNHNLNLVPNDEIVLVLDMWEHAYYLDYKNDKKTYAQNFWQIVNWSEVEKRLNGLN